MNVTIEVWLITIALMAVVFIVDLLVIGRRPHEPSMREAGITIGVFIGLAVVFGLGIWWVAGARYAGEFFAGWLTEYSLSVDNLFIFVLIMANLRVPRKLQQFALMFGIILALVFRGIFIALGAAAIERFSWIFNVSATTQIYTAVRLYLDYRQPDDEEEATENAVMRWVRRTFRSTPDFRGTRLTVREDGRRLITPMLFVVVALGTTDLLFALDSIPATFGVTQEPYLVFAANAFALLGLRALYFLLKGLLDKLVYLSTGLSIILIFIGVKLVLTWAHETWPDTVPKIPTNVSLTFIIGVLLITGVASWLKVRKDPTAIAHAGRITGGDHKDEEAGPTG
jgi:tellurite resistance protein TerC